MAALCKASAKSAGIGLFITAICKNAEKKTLGQDDFFVVWFQRSRALWAIHGDKNSKYFHSRATQRYRRNKIEVIKNARGQWCLDPKEVAKELLDFYSDLFSSTQSCQPELALETVQCIITEEMNKDLLAEFTKEEVKKALNQTAPLKAPGPDDMPHLFYQHYWELVGKDITTSVLYFLT